MEVLKGVVKVVLALIALGAGSELGKRGVKDLKDSLPKKSN
jgi:hypothetical protein